MDMMTNRSSPSMRTRHHLMRKLRSRCIAKQSDQLMKRYGCDADLGVVMRAWFLRIFHDATSGRKGFCVLCSHLFHEKKQGSELSPEPCSETGGEGGIRTPEALIRTCTLSRGVHSTSLPLLRRNPSACDRGRCVSQAGCSCICRRIGLVISVDPRTSGVKA